jgi:hypothetical protein
MRCRISAVVLVAALASCGKDDGVAPVSASARVKVVNAIAGANGVDFAVGDQRTFTGLSFTAVAPSLLGTYTALPAETPLRLRVYLGSATLIDSTVTLLADVSYTLVATGTSSGTGTSAPRFVLLQDNVTAPASGSLRLRALHAATSVGTVDIHAVLAGTQFGATTRSFANLSFRSAGSVDVPSGTYQVCVLGAGVTPTPTGTNCAILISTGVQPAGTAFTALARDANTPAETTPQLQFVIDRAP